jgi:hypothetical protein
MFLYCAVWRNVVRTVAFYNLILVYRVVVNFIIFIIDLVNLSLGAQFLKRLVFEPETKDGIFA